ncbi:MAG: HIT domain-containing protein [Candidatus Omnitrophota bacterium]
MDKLWAPWRVNYVQSKKGRGCVFCQGLKNPDKNYVVFKTGYSFCILNIYPYNNGHLMVGPLRHVADTSRLKEDEALDLFRSLNQAKKILDKILKPQGYNLGINLKAVAGAGVAGHLHIHIVPRWKGDTNFMPVLAKTKVISQSLKELYKQLKDEYKKTGS